MPISETLVYLALCISLRYSRCILLRTLKTLGEGLLIYYHLFVLVRGTGLSFLSSRPAVVTRVSGGPARWWTLDMIDMMLERGKKKDLHG